MPAFTRRFRLIASLAAVALGGETSGAQRTDTAATKAWLLAADRALAGAVETRGAASLIEALTPEAAVLIPGQPILSGRDAEQPFLQRYGGASKHRWRALAAVASTDNAFGCTVGLTTFTGGTDSLHRERAGQYVMCWRRSPRGEPQLIGLQRNDAPPGVPLPSTSFDGGAMPHSGTMRSGSSALGAAQDADAAFAAEGGTIAGPLAAFVKYVAADGLFPGETEGARGPAMVREAFAGWPAGRLLLWAPTRSMGYAAGGLAFTVGEATNRKADSDEGLTRSKYLTVWRLEADGSWKWIFDLGSPRP